MCPLTLTAFSKIIQMLSVQSHSNFLYTENSGVSYSGTNGEYLSGFYEQIKFVGMILWCFNHTDALYPKMTFIQ